MKLAAEVNEELRKTNISRNRFAYLGAFLIIFLSVWHQTNFEDYTWQFTLALGFCGCLFRFFATEIVPDEKKVSDFFMVAGFFLLGVTWSYHFHTHFDDTYPIDKDLIYLWFTLGGTILVCHITLVAHPPSFLAIVAPVYLTVLWEYSRKGLAGDFYVVICVVTLSLLMGASFRNQHQQLKEFIRAKLEADRERRRMKKIVEGMPGFVGMTDEKGTYVHGNKNILTALPNLIGTRVGELSHTSSYASFVWEFLHSDKDSDTRETEVMIAGEHYHLFTTCGRLNDGGVIVFNVPINELVKARKELRDKEALDQYSSKLMSIGKMAAGVAHEVNNPLAIIAGSANIINDLVQEEEIDRKNLKLFSEKIVQTSERIAQIVRSLRSLSRGGEKDPFAPLSLQGLINSVLDISNANFKQQKVQIILPENKKDLTVMGREVQLGQVLLNLLSNAIDAVKDQDDRWVKIDYGHTDGHVWMEVSDSGKGIPAEIAEKIMDPFFTTKSKDGTGLGLTISYKILEEHGGRLSYESSRPNTTFRMRFPTPKV